MVVNAGEIRCSLGKGAVNQPVMAHPFPPTYDIHKKVMLGQTRSLASFFVPAF